MLHEFLTLHRTKLIQCTREKVAARAVPPTLDVELENGIPLFLDQLAETLQREQETSARPTSAEMSESALLHGAELRKAGFTLAQVVHGYGDVCQAVTGLAMELEIGISPDEFKTLNRCLDEAIAQAVTEFARQRDVAVSDRGAERQGFFVHELRNLLGNAFLALEVLKTGRVAIGGSMGALLERNLVALRNLVERTVEEVRAEVRRHHREHVPLTQLMTDVGQPATIEARARGLELTLTQAEPGVVIDVDRQLIEAALGNLLQNAVKFSRPSGQIALRADTATAAGRVLIEVEDACGGLGPDTSEELFRPFEQQGADRSGLGLGLAIARANVEVHGGQIRVRSLPGRGCVFTVDLPVARGASAAAAGQD